MKELFVSENDWDSHRPMLWAAIKNVGGNFVEFGCGDGSTPLLMEAEKEKLIRLYSFDTNKEWAGKYKDTKVVSSYINIAVSLKDENIKRVFGELDILFVDCAPGEIRKDLIRSQANCAKVIIAHDTEIGSNYVYGMAEILSTFKYRKDYKPEGKPWTTAVSNFIDVGKWEL
jgi:hypothetical protein